MATNSKEYQMLFSLSGQMNPNFSKTFSSASKEVQSLQKEMAELSNQKEMVTQYEKQQSAIERTGEKLQLLQKQYENINREFEETGGKSSALQNKLLSKQAQIDKTSESLNKQTVKLSELGGQLEAAGISTRDLEGEQKRLEAQLMETAEKQAKFSETTANMSSVIDTAGSALAAAGFGKMLKEYTDSMSDCLNVSGDFQSAMSQVAATMGTSNGSVSDLADYAKEMGATTAFTAIQAAEGLNILAQAGLDANEQMSGLPVVLDLASAGNMDLAQSAGYVTTTVKAFSDNMENAGKYADLMATGAASSNTSVQQLGEALATAGADAAAYSQDADSVTLSLMRLAEQGEVGAAAGTMLTRAMTDLYSPTAEAQKQLDALGFSAYDSSGRAKDFNDAIDELNSSLDGMTEAEKNAALNAIFTTNGLSGFNKMTTSSAEKVDQFKEALENSSGSAAQQAKTQLDNMSGAYTIMQSAIEGVQNSMGELYQEDMTGLYKEGAKLLTQVNEFIKNNPTLVKSITAGTVATLGLGTGIAGLKTGMDLLGPVMKVFSVTVGGIPLGAAVAGVGALTAGGVALYDALTADDRAAAAMSSSALDLIDSINDANSTFTETSETIRGTSDSADFYIEKLKEMEAAGDGGKNASLDYHNTLELLCQTIPDLTDIIDLENNSIQGGTAALEERSKAWMKEAQAQAYREKMQAVYKAEADAQIELKRNQIALTDATEKATDAQKKLDDANSSYKDTLEEYHRRLDNCAESGERYADVHDEMEKYMRDAADAMTELESNLYEAQNAQEIAQKAVDNGADALRSAQDEVESTAQALGMYTDAQNNAADATQANADTLDDFSSIINGTSEQMQTLTDAYNDALSAAQESIAGQWGLWDEAAKVSETSIGTINKNLEGQTDYWEEYNNNLELVRDNVEQFEGLGDVLSSFVDGSENSVNAVAGIADAIKKGDDGSVQKMIDNYKDLQKEQKNVSDSVADLQTQYTEQMAALTDSATASVAALDLSDEARAAARSTISAYIGQISGGTDDVSMAYKNFYNAARDALTNGGGSSGSRKKKVRGYATGTTSADPGLAWVGEEGPELVAFQGGETVVTAARSEAIAGGLAGSVTNNISVPITINGSATPDALTRLESFKNDIGNIIEDKLRDMSEDRARRAFC